MRTSNKENRQWERRREFEKDFDQRRRDRNDEADLYDKAYGEDRSGSGSSDKRRHGELKGHFGSFDYSDSTYGFGGERSGYEKGIRRTLFHNDFGGRTYREKTSRNYGNEDDNLANSVIAQRDQGAKNQKLTDERILEDIKEIFSEASNLDASGIYVHVEMGEVLLTGTVSELPARRIAGDLSDSVYGVKNVVNRLEVRSNDQPGS